MTSPAMVLDWAPAAFVPLAACSPTTREKVYEPKASHRLDWRFSNAITRPLYLSDHPGGFVTRKRRSAVEFASANTGTIRPSGIVRVSSRYRPPISVHPI